MSLAICVICYNRIAPLKRVLKSLEAAHYDAPIPLIISIDKSETTAIEDFVEAIGHMERSKPSSIHTI